MGPDRCPEAPDQHNETIYTQPPMQCRYVTDSNLSQLPPTSTTASRQFSRSDRYHSLNENGTPHAPAHLDKEYITKYALPMVSDRNQHLQPGQPQRLSASGIGYPATLSSSTTLPLPSITPPAQPPSLIDQRPLFHFSSPLGLHHVNASHTFGSPHPADSDKAVTSPSSGGKEQVSYAASRQPDSGNILATVRRKISHGHINSSSVIRRRDSIQSRKRGKGNWGALFTPVSVKQEQKTVKASSPTIGPVSSVAVVAGASPAPPKSRRVRTGCLTCRERHLKCDEGTPDCLNCRKGSRECKRGLRLNYIDIQTKPIPYVPPTTEWKGKFFRASQIHSKVLI